MPDEDEAEAEQPTAAGEGDATAIVLAPTQAAPELAWSAADEEDEEPSRWGPVWLRALVMVSCAAAVAITVTIIGLIVKDANAPRPGLPPGGATPTLAPALPPIVAPPPPPTRAPSIHDGLAPKPVPTTVTVTQTPAAAVPPPAPPKPARSADQIFLDEMAAAGYPITETAVALAAAPKGCGYLESGHTPAQAAELAMHNNPAISLPEAQAYVRAAIDAYCPGE